MDKLSSVLLLSLSYFSTLASEDINTVTLEWYTFRVGSHVDKTEFEITRVDKKKCTKYLDIGAFACLYGELEFRRNIGNYMIKRIIPSFIIVIITFIGFWIPTTPARTSLPITALLALITQQIQSDLSVSYVYALQVWNIVCIVFVFANLLEFSLALYEMHMFQKRASAVASKNTNNNDDNNNNNNNQNKQENDEDNGERNKKNINVTQWRRLNIVFDRHFKTTSRHSSVDMISRYLFPITFFLFVIIFFVWVLI